MKKIPVLMYHSIYKANGNVPTPKDYVILEEDFQQQMTFLKEEGYSTLLFSDILSTRSIPEKSVIITFDDGHLSNYTIAFPILLKLGFKAEFFITSEQIDDGNTMNIRQLQDLIANGMSIGSHGRTHSYLDELDDERAEEELRESMLEISNKLGISIYSFSAPGGRFKSKHIKMAVDLGYKVFCTSVPGYLKYPSINLLQVPRIPLHNGNIADYALIVKCERVFYLRKRILWWVLHILKTVLGNQRYEKIRSFIISL